MEKVSWRGTPGVGDFMWALNSCHMRAWQSGLPINLEMHWDHSEDHLHHFEDPETIIQRMYYIHNFYQRKDDVEITHIFNSRGRYYYPPEKLSVKHKNRFWFESGSFNDAPGCPAPTNDWLFRKNTFKKRDPNKIVFWRPLFNAEVPRKWKRTLTNSDWEIILDKVSRRGMSITELTYRTPISEALYHISTARLIICYDGMWHYIAKNLATPMVVCSNEGVTKYHTPHAIRATHHLTEKTNIFWWCDNLKDLLRHSNKKAVRYFDKMEEIYKR